MENIAASTDGPPKAGTSIATKRSLEEDPGMACISRSQVGGERKRQNRGDEIVADPPSKVEKETSSTDTKGKEVEKVGNYVKDGNEESGSGEGESSDSEYSELESWDVVEFDRKEIKEQLTGGSSILVLESTSN
jgi:hypothetical protein